MKKSITILLILVAFILVGCIGKPGIETETFYVEGYFKDDWGDGKLHEWYSTYVIGAFLTDESSPTGYDIANEGDTHNDYFKIENLPEGEYDLKVYTDYNDGDNLIQLWGTTPNATKHINLTKNSSITILFGEDE